MLHRGYPIHADFDHLEEKGGFAEINPVSQVVLDGFRDRVFDQVAIAYTQFGPGVRLKPTVRQLLPVRPLESPGSLRYIYEPGPREILLALLPRFVRFQLYRCFTESLAAENISRMIAMRTATRNANDLMHDLVIDYNKARQQSITAEILDIIGGSAALGES